MRTDPTTTAFALQAAPMGTPPSRLRDTLTFAIEPASLVLAALQDRAPDAPPECLKFGIERNTHRQLTLTL